MLIISVIKFQDFEKFQIEILEFLSSRKMFQLLTRSKFLSLVKKINDRPAMKFNHRNREIWADAMRDKFSQRVLPCSTAELHLQKVYTSSVRLST